MTGPFESAVNEMYGDSGWGFRFRVGKNVGGQLGNQMRSIGLRHRTDFRVQDIPGPDFILQFKQHIKINGRLRHALDSVGARQMAIQFGFG